MRYPTQAEVKIGELNPMWKGDEVSYRGLHSWIHRHLPKVDKCQKCGTDKKKLEAGNVSQEYKREVSDWIWVCRPCNNLMSRNTSGVIGVYLSKKKNLWVARIDIKGKRLLLGQFKNFKDAVKARKGAEKVYEFMLAQ